MLRVRPATQDDVPVIIGLIDEASDWLAAKGTDQWSKPWPNRKKRDKRISRGVRDRCTWMVEDDGSRVATISCTPTGSRKLWKRSERTTPAIYVSRLIVRRSHGGQHLGEELVDWAGLWAAEQYGAQWIRIDVWTTNKLLHEYYEKRGFTFCRHSRRPGYPSAMLFQKCTAGITRAEVPRLHDRPALRPPGRRRAGTAPLAGPAPRCELARQLAGLVVLEVLATRTALSAARSARRPPGHR